MKRRWFSLVLVPVLAASLVLLLAPRVPASAATTPEPKVDAKVEIVWPHDQAGREAPVATAPFVNVVVYLFQRGTLDPVPCDFSNPVTLNWAGSMDTPAGEVLLPAQDLPDLPGSAVGQRVTRAVDGKSFSAWVFNNIPIHSPMTYFFVDVGGADTRTNVWAHGAETLTQLPHWDAPRAVGGADPTSVDALIQTVWTHDAQGNPTSLNQADLANVGVDLAEYPANAFNWLWTSVGVGLKNHVQLLRALNQGFLEPTGDASETVTMTAGDLTWSRWEFDNVDVSAAKNPQNRYYFAVSVDGVVTHTTIWAHGSDPRTYFPQPDVPARSC